MRPFKFDKLESAMTDFLENTHVSAGGDLDAPIDWQAAKELDIDPEDDDQSITQDTTCMSVTQDIEQREDVNPKEGVTKYGEVKFADPKNKKYPLDTEAHVRAAASYFGMAKNRALYKEDEQKTIQGRIDAAKKKFKIGSK